MTPSLTNAGKPDDVSQEAWDAAEAVGEAVYGRHERGFVMWPLTDAETLRPAIARAIRAAATEAHADLVDCLSDMTEHYVQLAGCGDCGFWDPELEIEVIAAREMIAKSREVNTAHNKIFREE